jgi:hypothetical protein
VSSKEGKIDTKKGSRGRKEGKVVVTKGRKEEKNGEYDEEAET